MLIISLFFLRKIQLNVFLFLFNFRVTVITLTAMPLSLGITILIFDLLDMSVNSISPYAVNASCPGSLPNHSKPPPGTSNRCIHCCTLSWEGRSTTS